MKLEDLSPELQEKIESCETVEELTNLAEAEGIELSDEDLDGIAGGVSKKKVIRPRRRLLKKTRPQPTPQPQTSPDSVLPTADPITDNTPGTE